MTEDSRVRVLRLKQAQAKAKAAPSGRVMSQVNRGIADSIGGLVDFINPFDEFTGSAKQGMIDGMNAMNMRIPEGEAQTAGESFQRGVGQAAGSIIPVAKGLQALKGAGGVVGQFADDALAALSSWGGVSAEMVAGGMSGGAEKAAENAGAPEWVQNTAAIAAPMSIPAAAGVISKGAKIGPSGIIARRLGAELAPFTKSGGRQVAGERMKSLAGGEERANELAQRISGENPLNLTPAQQTGDPNMLAVERLAADQDPNLRASLEKRRAAGENTAQTDIAGMGGDVSDAQGFFDGLLRRYKSDLQARADRAVAAATGRVQGIDASRPESQNSQMVTDKIKFAMDAELGKERELWGAIDRDATVGTENARDVAEGLIADTSHAQRFDIPNSVRELLDNPEVYGDETTVREMYGLYSALRGTARSAMAGNDKNENMARIANSVADAILEDLGAVSANTPIGREINEARAFSAALHETFDRGAPGRLLKRTLDGDTAIDPEMALRRTVGRGGTEGMVTSRQIEKATNDGAKPFITDYLRGEFAKSATNQGTGEVTLAGARRFIANNKELLGRYPELRTEIDAAVKQGDTAERLSERISGRIAALEDAKRSAMAKFVGSAGDKAVNAVLDAKNPIQAARKIANAARKDESGKALAGVKGAFTDHLIGSATKTKGGQTGLDATALNSALADPRMKTALSQIFTEGEMSRLRLIGRELAKLQTGNAANIGSELSGARANRLIEMVARIGAARHGAQLGGGSGGSIQTAQMASSRVKDALSFLASDKASRMMADAVTDPDLFKALLTQTAAPGAEKRAIPYFIPYLIGGTAAAAQN